MLPQVAGGSTRNYKLPQQSSRRSGGIASNTMAQVRIGSIKWITNTPRVGLGQNVPMMDYLALKKQQKWLVFSRGAVSATSLKSKLSSCYI